MAMTYTSLVEQIAVYANRRDAYFIDSIPYFIGLAQARINREAKDIGFQESEAILTTQGVPSIAKPADWNQTVSLLLGVKNGNYKPNVTPLFSRTYEFCRTYWPLSTTTAKPMFYADDAGGKGGYGTPYTPYTSIWLAPTPDAVYPLALLYLQRPVELTAENSTNFLTDRVPDLLFYACMVETTPFLKDDERIPVWEAMYNRALQSNNLQTKQRYLDRTSQRDKD